MDAAASASPHGLAATAAAATTTSGALVHLELLAIVVVWVFARQRAEYRGDGDG